MSRELKKIAFVLLIFTFNSPFFPWRRCFSLHSKEKWFWVLAGYSGHRHWVPGHLPPATVLCSFYSKYYIQKLLWKNWISSGINHVIASRKFIPFCHLLLRGIEFLLAAWNLGNKRKFTVRYISFHIIYSILFAVWNLKVYHVWNNKRYY